MGRGPWQQRVLDGIDCLVLVSPGGTAATGLLELATLGADVWGSRAVGDTGGAEVAVCLASLAGALEEDGVLALGGAEGKLVKGDALATGSDNTLAGTLGEAKSAHAQLGCLVSAVIVCDSTNNNGDLA